MTVELRFSPAAERNKQPIVEVLRDLLPDDGEVLEVAAGTGQHVVHFASVMPGIIWQPTDPDHDSCATIATRIAQSGLTNIHAPIELDVHAIPWPVHGPFSGLVCCNMIHISPWSATRALFAGARTQLAPRAPLILYGPFKEGGSHTAESNLDFDESLRSRNPEWGVRDLTDVQAVAESCGFVLQAIVNMPANNRIAVFTLRAMSAV
ncbi:MAG: DUF938 domain-containing protein [Pseudomonadales bacterium]|nr:DUF938 domain-containing protein [Pseudomonadales bacterium]